jgi:hypothetical protein
MDKNQIRATQAKRFAFLQLVYQDWQDVRAGRIQAVSATDIRQRLGVDSNEGDRIEEYLKGRGLIKYVTMGPTIAITPFGIDYVENALSEPDSPTEFFPAVNVLHIGSVINSQIQQGTTDSQQHGEWQGLGSGDLKTLVKQLKAFLESTPLTTTQKADAEANVLTLEAQSIAHVPNKSIVREAMRSLRNIAEATGAAVIAEKLARLML